MPNQVNLLRSLPKSKRNITARKRAKDEKVVQEAKRFGKNYFDGSREYGYGGYKYDGRWIPVAKDIIEHFKLCRGMRVLDIGCGKGFLVNDLMYIFPSLEVFGIDISHYAIMNCFPPSVIGRLHLGSAIKLPFPDQSFDCVLSINTLHNLPRAGVVQALQEMRRVWRRPCGGMFVQVDSYHTSEQKTLFEDWVLTAEFHDYPQGWLEVFKEAGYDGDYDWTIIK